MDKKELKFYEAPACEVVELNVVSSLLAGSGNAEGVGEEEITEGDMNLDD
jgi:hypothetical protein